MKTYFHMQMRTITQTMEKLIIRLYVCSEYIDNIKDMCKSKQV